MPRFSFDYTQDVETVYRFLTNPDAMKKRHEDLGERNVQVSVDEGGGTTTVTIIRDVERDMPGFAKKFFPATNKIVERQEWRASGDTKTCKSHVDVQGTPGQVDSDVTLSPNGGGCTYDVQLNPIAKVPLIRKKIEELIGKISLETLEEQHQYNKRELDSVG